MADYRSRITGLRRVKASDLEPHPENWRTHPPEQVGALEGVLGDVGFAGAVVARELDDGRLQIIDGHARVEAMGDQVVPVLVTDLGEDEARLVLATYDPIGAMAGADGSRLASLLDDLPPVDDEALDDLLADLRTEADSNAEPTEGATDPDAVPDEPGEPSSRLGEVYELGRHRVMCGDCTTPEFVVLALNGKGFDAMLTDPPYGLGDKRLHSDGDKDGPGKVDWDAEPWDLRALPVNGHKALVWGAQYYGAQPRELGLMTWSCWDKRSMYEGGGCITGGLELCCANFGRGTVWSIAWGPYQAHHQGIDHPTAKPVELIRETVLMATDEGERVYDPFLGSGTTLIAAEQLGRTCYGLEIEPRYVDVIRQRYADFVDDQRWAP